MRLNCMAVAAALACAGMLGTAQVSVAAEDFERTIGRMEYQANCASCHGMKGKGDGPVAPELQTSPPDLTRIMARNDGRFPFFDIYDVVAGETVVTPHGDPEMPVWGTRLSIDTERSLEFGPPFREGAIKEIVEGRILRIVYYIRSIQEQ